VKKLYKKVEHQKATTVITYKQLTEGILWKQNMGDTAMQWTC
jgi:hypothetical protein